MRKSEFGCKVQNMDFEFALKLLALSEFIAQRFKLNCPWHFNMIGLYHVSFVPLLGKEIYASF